MTRWTLTATALLVGGLLAGCGSAADDDGGTATSTDTTTLELTVPSAQSGRCMPPNVDNLRAQDTAFEGVVTELSGSTAFLSVEEGFKGVEAGKVTVTAPSQDLQDLLLAVDFVEGETYLVSSLDGQVSVCGLSGPKDDLLVDLYQQAYAD